MHSLCLFFTYHMLTDIKPAMLCLGPGEDNAALHNPDNDFPDDLIPVCAAIFERIAEDLLGRT
jgi:hypothetical protein